MAGELSPHATLIDLLSARAASEPESIAFIFLADGEEKERITYGALHRRACAVGAYLQASAIAGDRALLLLPSGLDFVISFFAALYAGMIAVPAYPPSARVDGKTRRLQAIVQDARPSRVLTTAQLAGRLQAHAEHLFGAAELVQGAGVEDAWADRWQQPPISAESTAFLQYTSGSTALPKGVMVSHRNILSNERMIQTQFGRSAESTVVSWLPQYHDMGLVGGLLQPLYTGSLGVFLSPSAFLQQPIGWLKAISHYQAHTSGGPNFAYDLVVSMTTEEQRHGLDLSSWRVAFNGAEPIRLATIDRFSQAFEPYGFRRESFFPCYGLAEATLIVTGRQGLRTVPGAVTDAAERSVTPRPFVSCGLPVVGTDVVIVDPATGVACPAGQIGEIWVQSPSVASGYWRQTEVSARTFGASLAGRQGSFLRSGDLGCLVDGELMVAGRLKDLIIVRGENYYPEDLEVTASDCHAAVRFQPGAVFTADIDGGDALVVVHGVDRAHRADLDLQEAARSVREAISQHHALRVHTVVLVDGTVMPRTSSGKVQRHLCREQFQAGTFPSLLRDTIASTGVHEAAAPVSLDMAAIQGDGEELESALRQEIAAVMKLDPADLSPERPLTAWGLDSLVATAIHHTLLQRFDVDVPVISLLGGLTLREILAVVTAGSRARRADGIGTADTATRSEEASHMSVEQQRLWLLSQIAPQKSAYNVSAGLPIDGPLQPDLLRRAVDDVVRGQDILRACISAMPTGPVLRIASPSVLAWSQQTIVAASRDDRDEIARRAGVTHAETPFDLERGPLIRFHLLLFGPADAVLLVCAHHIIMDAESFRILFERVTEGYATLAAGPPVPIAGATPDAAATAAAWQPWSAIDPRTEEHLAYWRRQLADLPQPLDLSHAHPAAPGQGGAVDSVRFSMTTQTTAGLRELGKGSGSTLFMLLLAGWHAAFHRWTGRRDWLSAIPVSGRRDRARRDVMGSFAYPLLLRATVLDDVPLRTLIETTRADLLQAYDHQDLAFTHVVEHLRGQSRSARSPLVQMLFSVLKVPEARPIPGDVVFGTPYLIRATTDVALFVTIVERPDALEGTLFYQTDLVDGAHARALVDSFHAMLGALIHHPDWTPADVPLPAVRQRPGRSEIAVTEPDALRICVASSFAAEPLQAILEFWGRTLRTPWTIAIAPPGQIVQELLDPESALSRNSDGINILLAQPYAAAPGAAQILDAVSAFQQRSSSPLIVAVCPEEAVDEALVSAWTRRLAEIPGVHVVGPKELLETYPVDTVYDDFGQRMANLPFSDHFYTAAGTVLSRTTRALTARPYKVIVLDCDHTLWSGVCAEDGPAHVRIDGPHAFLQRFVLAQQRAGMLLGLCSKNSAADVWATFAAHPSMPLTADDFVATRINWLAKSTNLQSLAAELDLGLDSFIYIDDNPLECAEVESHCPGVLTLCVQQADDIPRLLAHAWAFDRLAVTADDAGRTARYRQAAARRALTDEPLSMDAFIAGLALQIDIAPVRAEDIVRVAQLSSRVNQFTCSMRRYSATELARTVANPSAECLVAHVRDRFGDYGLVGAAVLHETEQTIQIEAFFLSCRALGRGVEYALLNEVGKRALRRGLPRVEIDAQGGPRNAPAQAFLTGLLAAVPFDAHDRVTMVLDAQWASHASSSNRVIAPRRAPADVASVPVGSAAGAGGASALASIATRLRTITEIAGALQSSRALRAEARRSDDGAHAGVAATTDVEKALAAIWEEIIGVRVTDVSQDLFALGGDSLLAVRILGRIHETFQIALSLDELFMGSLTVQGVALAVEQAMVSHATPSVS